MESLPKDTILNCLQTGQLDLQGQFVLGSNYTLLVTVITPPERFVAVYKPERGERPLWDFPFGSLEKREAAAYLVSDALGWELVPPVVYRLDGPMGPGSVQVYIEHDPNYHYFNFNNKDANRLRPAAVFDLLINNADRKGGHFLIDESRHIWLIDHGLCFHQQDKLRTVVWDFAGEQIPADLLKGVEVFLHKLATNEPLQHNLNMLLSHEEIRSLRRRCERLLKTQVFPLPDEQQRQYPWPPV